MSRRLSISRRSIGASVSVSKAFSGFSAPAGAGACDHQHQVLDADAVGGGFVIARLVRQDHAAAERDRPQFGDARRAFVHRQVAADAVAGAVVEIEPGLPQRGARQRIELGAAGVLREHRAGDGDMALEHAGEAVAHLVGRRADRDGAGDVGGAVLVLRAGIDQEQLVLAEGAVGGAGDAVMHDRPVRPGAGDGRERNVLQQAAIAAEAFQRLHRVDLGQLAGRRLAREPGQEARHRHAVARVRGARACDLGVVLHGFHQPDRVGAAYRLAAAAGQQPRERVGRARLVEPHGLVLELRKVADKIVGRAQRGDLLQRGARFVVELGRSHIERGLALARDNREGERQRRMRDIRAADVEGPGDVLRVRHHQHIGA